MKIIKLTKQQQRLFSWMDPFLVLERLEFPGSFALAATESADDEEAELPAGLMICHFKTDRLVIDWLWIAEQFRQQGIGDALLSAAVAIAEQRKLKYVSADMRMEFGQELICLGAEDYFGEHLFQKVQELPGEWMTSLQRLSMNPYLKMKPKMTYDVELINSLDQSKLRNVVAGFSKTPGVQMLYPVAGEESRLEQNVSCVIRDKDTICGGLMIQAVGNTLYPVLLAARSLEEANALMHYSLIAALKKYHKPMDVRIILNDQTLVPLIERILPGQRIVCKRYTAETDAYRKDLKISEELTCTAYLETLDEILQKQAGDFVSSEETEVSADETQNRAIEEQDMILTLRDFQKCELLQKNVEIMQIQSVEEMDLQKLYMLLGACQNGRPCTWFPENMATLPITWFEPELSCYYEKNGQIEIVLFVHREASGRLWAEYLYLRDETPQSVGLIMDILRFAVSKALKKYPLGTEVAVRCHTKNISILLDRLFPEAAEQ